MGPGFDFADFERPPRATLLQEFLPHGELSSRLTRA